MSKKKKKNSAKNAADDDSPPISISPAPAKTKKRPARKTAPKKATGERVSKAPASNAKTTTEAGNAPTDAEISIRAYFIAERRLQLGLPGDSDHDWLEARRQLNEEATQRGS